MQSTHTFDRIFDCTFEQINQIAKIISENLTNCDVVLLNGDLGAGKTFFVQKICSFLNSKIKVSSPTFGLYNVYDFENLSIWHYDLYRLKSEQINNELMNLDLDEAISNNVTMIEWAEKLNIEFENSLFIRFSFIENEPEKRILHFRCDEKSKWAKILNDLSFF